MDKLLYMRKVEFRCGSTMTEPLTIHFTIPFDDTENVNDAEIKVYNLKDSTINSIKLNEPAILNAGYRDDSGVIFSGILKNKKTEWQDLDKITTFTCVDSPVDYLNSDFKKSYTRNTLASTIINDVASFAGLKIGEIDLPRDFIYRTGKTVYGKPKTILTELAKDCNAKLFINKGRLYIRDKNKGTEGAIVVSKETGLIGTPERLSDETTANGKKQTRNGYKVVTLLNHRITVDSIISLQSEKLTGFFRVEKGQHVCNDNDFYTEMEVYPV